MRNTHRTGRDNRGMAFFVAQEGLISGMWRGAFSHRRQNATGKMESAWRLLTKGVDERTDCKRRQHWCSAMMFISDTRSNHHHASSQILLIEKSFHPSHRQSPCNTRANVWPCVMSSTYGRNPTSRSRLCSFPRLARKPPSQSISLFEPRWHMIPAGL